MRYLLSLSLPPRFRHADRHATFISRSIRPRYSNRQCVIFRRLFHGHGHGFLISAAACRVDIERLMLVSRRFSFHFDAARASFFLSNGRLQPVAPIFYLLHQQAAAACAIDMASRRARAGSRLRRAACSNDAREESRRLIFFLLCYRNITGFHFRRFYTRDVPARRRLSS